MARGSRLLVEFSSVLDGAETSGNRNRLSDSTRFTHSAQRWCYKEEEQSLHNE